LRLKNPVFFGQNRKKGTEKEGILVSIHNKRFCKRFLFWGLWIVQINYKKLHKINLDVKAKIAYDVISFCIVLHGYSEFFIGVNHLPA